MSMAEKRDNHASNLSPNLGGRARTGTLWIVAGFGLGQVLRLGANVALAALLFEEVFALMAIVTAIMVGLTMFSDLGLQTNVVQSARGDDPDFLGTVWTLQVIRGVVLFILALAMAWPLSSFYSANDPKAQDLLYLIPIVALTSLIDGLRPVSLLTAARHLNIKELTLIEFIVTLFHLMVMLILAWYSRSVYSLAIASVLSALLHLVLGYRMFGAAGSRFRWDPMAFRAIISFGKWVFLSTIISFLAGQLDRLALARMFALDEVGVYSIAASLAMIVPTLVGRLQGGILFPWYSRMLEQGMPIGVAFDRTRMAAMVSSSFMCAALFSGAGSFFEAAYDERYAMGGLLLPILAWAAWFSCIETMYGATFLASGRPQWVAWTNAIKVVSFALGLFLVAHFELGILHAAVFLVASEVLRWLCCLWLGRRIGLSNARVELRALSFFLLVSSAGWWLVERADMVSALHPLWRLVLLGVVIGLLFAPLFYRHVFPLVKTKSA